jgi:hypothetical protein
MGQSLDETGAALCAGGTGRHRHRHRGLAGTVRCAHRGSGPGMGGAGPGHHTGSGDGSFHLYLADHQLQSQPQSSASGSGAVDFASNSARATEIEAGNGSSDGQVRLGRTVYISFAAPGQPQAIWINIGRPPDSGQDLLGLDFINAAGALTGFSGPFHAVRVEDLGSAVIDGIPSTGYRVISGPTCASSRSDPPSDTAGPTDLWVDGDGRLVQVRSTSSASMGPPPTGAPSANEFPRSDWGTATTTYVLRFTGYGAPVTITAPPASRSPLGHSTSSFAVSSGC